MRVVVTVALVGLCLSCSALVGDYRERAGGDDDSAECRRDEDCTAPGPCETGSGACTEGTCVYGTRASGADCEDGNPCTSPDQCDDSGTCVSGSACEQMLPPECIDATTLRTHATTGVCEPESGCVFDHTDTTCVSCPNDCEDPCASYSCPPEAEGCRIGECVPTAPPECTYRNASNGTPCDGGEGVCSDGICVPPATCDVNDDCGFCQWCDDGTCVNQSGTDLRLQCTEGLCNSGVCRDGGCQPIAANTPCRAAGAGGVDASCDVEEVCDGTSLTCPDNEHEPAGTSCDLCATCDGSGNCDQVPATDPECQELGCFQPANEECVVWTRSDVCTAVGECASCTESKADPGTPCQQPRRAIENGEDDGWSTCDGLGSCVAHVDVHAIARTCAAFGNCQNPMYNREVAIFVWITGGPPPLTSGVGRCASFQYTVYGDTTYTVAETHCDWEDGYVDDEIVFTLNIPFYASIVVSSCTYPDPNTGAPLAECEGAPCWLCSATETVACPTEGTDPCW